MRRVGLYLAREPNDGGAFQYSMAVLEGVEGLPRERYAAVVAYSYKGWRNILAAHKSEAVFVRTPFVSKVAAYAWRKSGLPIAGWRKLAPWVDPPTRRLISLGCDLWIYPAQDPMAYLLPAPALASVADLMHRYEEGFAEVAGYRMRELHYRASCRYAKGVLVDSNLGKRQLVESYGIDDRRVYPLPSVPPSYMYATEDPPDFKERYMLPEKFFFYPAQFWTHKNHQRLLYATESLATTLPDIQLVFVGAKKNAYDRIVALTRKLGLAGRVQILGYLPNAHMPVFYRKARALIMPSFFGPTNIPPLEAMVVGCPIAASGTYGTPEQCGDAALYFDPTSVDDIAKCMAKLWVDDDLCAELSRRGMERSTRFSQDAFNRRLLGAVDGTFESL